MEQEEQEMHVRMVKKDEYGGDILKAWEATQPLPEGGETIELGTIKPKSLHPNYLVFWKIKRPDKGIWYVLMGAVVCPPGQGEIVSPLGVQEFKSAEAMHSFINFVKQQALNEWLTPWWKSPEDFSNEIH
jgi:hypothetical protein